MFDWLITLPQYVIPQHFLSGIVCRITRIETPWFKNLLIRIFSRIYRINIAEAADTNPLNYPSFNAFFTRALNANARKIDESENTIISPVDGKVSQVGPVKHVHLLQAKGQYYSVKTLLGNDSKLAEQFINGRFATLYLSPRDYHRIHMPCDGKLTQMRFIPGKLFSVNGPAVRRIPKVFARNERCVLYFETNHGPMALIMVGALFVGSMETPWSGVLKSPDRSIKDTFYEGDQGMNFQKGDEIGRFNLGSTVILLFPESATSWADSLKPEATVQLGQVIGEFER